MDTNRFIIRPFEDGDFTRDNPLTVEAWRGIFDGFRKQLGDEIFDYVYAGWEDRKFNEFGTSMAANAKNGMAFTIVDTTDNSIAAMGSHRISGLTGQICSNAVRADLRGLGIGSAMHRTLLDSMRKHGAKFASVGTGLDEAHASARRSYERAGFTCSTPHITYYRDNRNAPAVLCGRLEKGELPDGAVIRRPYSDAECTAIAELSVESWQPIWKTARELVGDRIYESMGDRQQAKYDSTLSMLKNDSVNGYGLYIDGKLAGFCSWRVENAPGGKLGVVGLNGVSDAFKGRGLGFVMQNCIVREMMAQGIVYSKVLTGLDDGHAPARRTYEKSGFDRSIPTTTYYMEL